MNATYLLLAALAVVTVVVALWNLFGAWRRARGERLIVCPENRQPAAVALDAFDAAFHDFLGTREMHLKSCTRWPEMAGCGQECLAQIESAPDGCRVRSLLVGWYEDKPCALCGTPFGRIETWEHRPALMSPDKVTMEWSEIPAVELPERMATHQPVCWNCHVVESLYRLHPEMVVERPKHWAHYH
jgi:hypothetical protein